MFETRMCALEGARCRARHVERHGRRRRLAALPSEDRRPRGLGARAVRQLPLHRRGSAAALRHRDDAGRRARSRRLGEGGQAQHPRLLLRDADQSRCSSWSISRPWRRSRKKAERAGRGRQRVRHAAAAAADAARRRHRGLFRDQAYRRPGTLPRRRGARAARSSSRRSCTITSSTPAPRSARSMPGCC